MIAAFAYVTAVSFKNRMLLRIRRLRNPRYLFSTLAGLAYFWFFFFRKAKGGGSPAARAFPIEGFGADIGSLIVLAIMVFAWALPNDSGGLEFSEAEIQFLFPAPLTRTQILTYKIFRAQPPLLISAVAMTFLGWRRGMFVGVWLAFVALSIYFTMTALGRARLRLAGIGFLMRLAIVVGLLVLLSWLVTSHFESAHLSSFASQLKHAQQTHTRMASPLRSPVLTPVLFVPRLLASAVFPSSRAVLATSCAAALGLAGLFFLIASRINVSFEEASLANAQRKISNAERARQKLAGTYIAFRGISAPFRLREGARPELAIVWKNITAALRISAAWMIILFVLIAVGVAQIVTSSNEGMHLTVISVALILCAVFPLMGAAIFAQDLRMDLSRIELLKSYPISGERLIAAEMAGPLLIISATELVLLGTTALLLQFFGEGKSFSFIGRPEFVTIALLFAIPVCAAQLLIRNAFAVLFPAWISRSKEEVRGFAVTGQRLLVVFGNLFLLAIVLLPAAIIIVPVYLLTSRYVHGPALLAIATVPAAALVAGEVLLGIRALGAHFDRADVATEAGEIRL